MNSPSELLGRAKAGRLSGPELASVVAHLQDPKGDGDPYTFLHILGRAGNSSYRSIVEPFLDRPDDPMLSRLALKILCDYWGESEGYLDTLARFIDGVAWDREGDVRLVAISTAGEYLRDRKQASLLGKLVHIFRDEREDRASREGAYFALARAMGREWNELPSAARHFDLSTEIDSDVIVGAEERLATE